MLGGHVHISISAKEIEAALSEEAKAYLEKVHDFRARLTEFVKEAEKLGKEGEHIKGKWISVDFDGDEHDAHDSLGDAFRTTCELDLVTSALYHFLDVNIEEQEG